MIFPANAFTTRFTRFYVVLIGVALNCDPCVAEDAADSGAKSKQSAPAIAGYADYDSFAKQVETLAKPGLAEISTLATTLGHRRVYLITISVGAADSKPAILVLGNVHAPQLVGSELAVRMARRLIDRSAKDEAVRELLERHTFYIIPRPSPDASEAFFECRSRRRRSRRPCCLGGRVSGLPSCPQTKKDGP